MFSVPQRRLIFSFHHNVNIYPVSRDAGAVLEATEWNTGTFTIVTNKTFLLKLKIIITRIRLLDGFNGQHIVYQVGLIEMNDSNRLHTLILVFSACVGKRCLRAITLLNPDDDCPGQERQHHRSIWTIFGLRSLTLCDLSQIGIFFCLPKKETTF